MKQPQRHAACATTGFTLVELMISVSILALLMVSVAAFQTRTQQTSKSVVVRAELERRGERVLQQITSELRPLGIHTLVPDPTSDLGTDTLTFEKPTDVTAAGVVTWSTQTTIGLVMDNNELDNGLDDDDDGRIDERRLVITRDVGTLNAKATTICHDVGEYLEGETANLLDDNGNAIRDEKGFCARRIGDLLYIYLTLESRADDGNIVRYTSSTAIVIHN
jgi:prepilin-type N-terminal cleavage/methylation domain-containing protein